MKHKILLLIFTVCYFICVQAQTNYDTTKPWTYWWWMGSAVDKENILKQLEDFQAAGLGGVHIIPIYGAKGYETQYKDFLSEEWMEMVAFTIAKAQSLGLGVDITVGTGWPYGGKMIRPEHAAKQLIIRSRDPHNTKKIALDIKQFKEKNKITDLVEVFASNEKESVPLLEHIQSGRIKKKLKKDDWTISLFGIAPTEQKVKRAAPGGEGLVMDYFDSEAVQYYFSYFDSIFANTAFKISPRAFYHDSYEVYRANWTDHFLERFQSLHGYNLMDYLYLLGNKEHPDYGLIAHDFRATLSELLYSEFTTIWTDWTNKHRKLSRNQAHGSPANILDLYGLADIPETESFGCSEFDIPNLACDPNYRANKFGRPSPLMMKFASSPAHLLNKPLVSSESATWLADHFKVSLRQVKPQMDELFTAGINHIFYHGITYSPQEAAFPGWLFYASTNFGQHAHFWNEFPLLNDYIKICQTLLQNAKPDNEVLLYFPIDELWTKSVESKLLLLLDVHHYDEWFSSTSFGRVAQQLWDQGFAFDYISDKQISQLKLDSDLQTFISSSSKYKTLVVPKIDYIPESTLSKLHDLAGNGFKIVFVEDLPKYFPGYKSNKIIKRQIERPSKHTNFLVSQNLVKDLEALGLKREKMKDSGLDFIRKQTETGKLYFITNLSAKKFEGILPIASEFASVTITDPLTNTSHSTNTPDKLYLNIPPGKSYILQTSKQTISKEPWDQYNVTETINLNSNWTVQFEALEDLPLKKEYSVSHLASWTNWGDQNLVYYSGKAHYRSKFQINDFDAEGKRCKLVFDRIHETAKIIINGTDCGTIWAFPNEIEIPSNILKKENDIEIVVGNLSANYMRKYNPEHPAWPNFYDINLVNIRYEPFEPEKWPAEPSGIIGDVVLVVEKKVR